MKSISTALRDHIDYRPRCLSEFGLKPGRKNLKLRNGLLIELRRGPAVHRILIRLPVNEEVVIAAAFAQYGIGIIAGRLPVDRYARHQLQKIKVFPSVYGQFLDLFRGNSRSC